MFDKKSQWWREAQRTVPGWSKLKPIVVNTYIAWRVLSEGRRANNWLVTVTTYVGRNKRKEVHQYPFELIVHARTCIHWWEVYGGTGCKIDFGYIEKKVPDSILHARRNK